MVHVPVKRLGEQQGGGHLKTAENYSEDEKYMDFSYGTGKERIWIIQLPIQWLVQ